MTAKKTETPQQFKLIVTDLDGTAIPSFPGGMPSPIVIEAIKKAKEKIKVSVATGRPYSMALPVIQALDISDISVFHGGSQLRNPITGEKLWAQPLGQKLMDDICEVCQPYCFEDEGEAPEIRNELPTGPIFTGNQDMMVLLALEANEAQIMLTRLKALPEINSLLVHSWVKDKFDIHISHIGASKRHAVEVLLGMMNIEKHEVLAIGDGGNDLPLFEAAGFKVAMGNAGDDLKAQADFVTDTVGNDGLAQVIEKFIL